MVKIIRIIAELINDIHDTLILLFKEVLPSMNDKDLHFWIMGVFGLVFYFIVDYVFERLARWSVELISLIYTLTVLLVIVFAIEIQQKITNRGVMDFEDIVSGMKGFIILFGGYALIKGVYLGTRWVYREHIQKDNEEF